MSTAKQYAKSGILKAVNVFFEYDTPKIVHIKKKKVGIINRLIQLAILGYIIGYAIVWKKGYQDVDMVESATTTKLKGTVYTNFSTLPPDSPLNHRIWDVADYVIPPQETDSFFVMTNVVVTQNQTQGTCQEDPSIPDALCHKDADCPKGEPVKNGNGVRTGKCEQSTRNSSVSVCVIHAWCDIENDVLPLGKHDALLADSSVFTVLIKNNIEFKKFNKKKRNILETQNPDYLQNCRYNKSDPDDRLCPIFDLGTVVHEAGENYTDMAVKGGVIAINIYWDCNLDLNFDYCRPEYSFRRLDPEKAKIAPGYNFRYANFYWENGTQLRDLYKAYGIRVVLKVSGQAGKFSLVPLLLNLGSGLGLLAIATVLCDMVVLYVLKKGPFYHEKKYFNVVDDDAFQAVMDDSDDEMLDPENPTGLLSDGQPEGYQSMQDTPNDNNGAQGTDNSTLKQRRPGGDPTATSSADDTRLIE